MEETSPPAWFSDAALEVESMGFLGDADDPGVDELWRRWQSECGSTPARAADAALYLLAQDVRRCWLVDRAELRPVPDRELTTGWLQKLSAISEGHLELGEVHEIWVKRGLFRRQELVRITYVANDATSSVSPTLVRGLLDLADLLAAGNASLTHGELVTIGFGDDPSRRVDRDHVCWVDPKTRQRLEDNRFAVTRPATTLVIQREGKLRDTAPKPAAETKASLFEKLERAALSTEHQPVAVARKPAWKPKVVAGEGPDTIDKFGGVPWLPPRMRMPRCPRCKASTFLALQLSARSLPLRLDVDGVLQVFLCAGDDPGGCFIEGGGFIVRLETREIKRREAGAERLHTPLTIVGWDEFSDEPGPCDWPADVDEDAADDMFDNGPAGGDKCGGFGKYPQSGEPRCFYPGCDKGQLVFQLESSWDGILENVYFGDQGKLFVYVCTVHHEPKVTGHIEYY